MVLLFTGGIIEKIFNYACEMGTSLTERRQMLTVFPSTFNVNKCHSES